MFENPSQQPNQSTDKAEDIYAEVDKTPAATDMPSIKKVGNASRGQQKGRGIVKKALIIVALLIVVFVLGGIYWRFFLSVDNLDSNEIDLENNNSNSQEDVIQPLVIEDDAGVITLDDLTEEEKQEFNEKLMRDLDELVAVGAVNSGSEQASDNQFDQQVMQDLENINNNFQQDDDGDGLSNGEEMNLGTNPNNPDTDGDGYSDGEEMSSGYDPLIPLNK